MIYILSLTIVKRLSIAYISNFFGMSFFIGISDLFDIARKNKKGHNIWTLQTNAKTGPRARAQLNLRFLAVTSKFSALFVKVSVFC